MNANLNTTSLLNIVLTWSLIFADEVGSSISAQPVGQLRKLLAKAVDRLQIHVCLRNQLWERDCGLSALKPLWKIITYQEDGTDAQHHKYHQHLSRSILLCWNPMLRGIQYTGYVRIYGNVVSHSTRRLMSK